MSKILDVRWFCGSTNTAIVKVEDEFDGIQYYIGAIQGRVPEEDARFVADYGSRFPKEAGDCLFGA